MEIGPEQPMAAPVLFLLLSGPQDLSLESEFGVPTVTEVPGYQPSLFFSFQEKQLLSGLLSLSPYISVMFPC